MIDDPAEALDILLEELKRQKAAGVRRVSITADSLTALKALAGTPAAQAAPTPAKPSAAPAPASIRPAVTPVAAAPKPAVVVSAAPIPDAPIFTLAAGPKAERLQSLRQLIDACAETKKHLSAPQRPLLGHGSLDAKVVFVGEAPTIVEMEAGQAFAGESGELLQKILSAAAINPADCYFVPVMVWRPEPPTQYGKRPPTAREIAFNLPYLRAQIDVVAPRAVDHAGSRPVVRPRRRAAAADVPSQLSSAHAQRLRQADRLGGLPAPDGKARTADQREATRLLRDEVRLSGPSRSGG